MFKMQGQTSQEPNNVKNGINITGHDQSITLSILQTMKIIPTNTQTPGTPKNKNRSAKYDQKRDSAPHGTELHLVQLVQTKAAQNARSGANTSHHGKWNSASLSTSSTTNATAGSTMEYMCARYQYGRHRVNTKIENFAIPENMSELSGNASSISNRYLR
eukprot:TRINITY_DN5698_c0_g1_i5.p2 TRINITY_DN5698_c0_g1~~TRINITY_DN5698_c0_g1_i5.p2  ORF type:complete len:160 (-),score=8.09 TRINITY_DN5698_c0_g1_i5:368-847(-)